MKTYKSLIKEAKSKTAVLVFGRFNPPTIGHGKLLESAGNIAQRFNAQLYVYGSQSQDPKKNPLSNKQKMGFMKEMFPKYNNSIQDDLNIRSAIDAAVRLNEGHDQLVMVVGSDRVADFKKLLEQYNGRKAKHGYYEYDSIKIVSAGERDPDAEGVSGASASKARELAAKGQWHEFARIALGGSNSKVIYDQIQDALGVEVALTNQKLYTEEVKEKPIVYIDMDGVLADFFGGVEKLYGVSHWKELTSDKTKDLKQEVINKITGTDFFATLPKFPYADQLIAMVKKFTGGTFSILTSPLRGDHEVSSKYKKLWINQHIENPDQTIITGRKESYAKDKASGTPNILIDDRPINIQRWQGAGGYGILYQANKDTISKVQQALETYGKSREQS